MTVIIKKPRDTIIVPVVQDFQPLENLHLELLEIKKKLRKGIPPISLKKIPKPIAKAATKPETIPIESQANENKIPDSIEIPVEETTLEPLSVPVSKNTESVIVPVKQSANATETTLHINPSKAKVSPKNKAGEESEDDDDDEDEEDDDIDDDIDTSSSEEETPKAPITKSAPVPPSVDDDTSESENEKQEEAGEQLTPEEEEAKEKEEYIWRFHILKKNKNNTGRNIPDFGEHDDLYTMKTAYNRTLREIKLDQSVATYRKILVIGIIAIEFASTWFLNIDLKGFYQSQMESFDQYDELLIELGEKSSTSILHKLPVEVRLLGFLIVQAGLFWAGKILTDKMNKMDASSLLNIFGMFMGGGPKVPQTSTTPQQNNKESGRKMKGPSINVDDMKKKFSRQKI